jgi:hypothetical protein
MHYHWQLSANLEGRSMLDRIGGGDSVSVPEFPARLHHEAESGDAKPNMSMGLLLHGLAGSKDAEFAFDYLQKSGDSGTAIGLWLSGMCLRYRSECLNMTVV